MLSGNDKKSQDELKDNIETALSEPVRINRRNGESVLCV